jgi:hypothetical protein
MERRVVKSWNRQIVTWGLVLAFSAAAQAQGLSIEPQFEDDAPVLLLGMPRNTDYALKATAYWENDGGFARPNNRTDRHYTAGVGLSLAWQAPWVNTLIGAVPSIGNEFDRERSDYAMGAVGTLQIFTPEHIELREPITDDRPYAGYTYAGVFFQRANRLPANGWPAVWESLELDVGIMGPSSLAENAQEMIHHYYKYQLPEGWDNQVHDELQLSLKYNRRWRVDAWKPPEGSPWWLPRFQILPELGFTAGTLQDELRGGAVFRLGWNMPDDFGPGRLEMPGDFTWIAPCSCDPYGWKEFWSQQSFTLFARPFGRLVAHNALLSGDNFRDADLVTKDPLPGVFGTEFGLTHRIGKFVEFTYSQTYQSAEFRGQKGWDGWGSLSLAFYIAW